MSYLFVYKEFTTNSGYGYRTALSPYNMEILISGSNEYVKRFIQQLATIFKMIAMYHINDGYIKKAIMGYEDIKEAFYTDCTELFVCNPKYPGKLPNQIPVDNEVVFEEADWEPDYEEFLKRRVTLDIDVDIDKDMDIDVKLSNYVITPVYKYGDPGYVSYHARKYVPDHKEYYNAMKEKVRLCAQGIADINHLLHSYIYGAWDVLFNEKLEVTKDCTDYYYEKGHDLLKPIYETKVYKVDKSLVSGYLLCKIGVYHVYVYNDNITVYHKDRPYAYTTDKRLYRLNTSFNV